MRAIFPVYFFILDLITRLIFTVECILESPQCSVSSLLHLLLMLSMNFVSSVLFFRYDLNCEKVSEPCSRSNTR
jgi:hypothetical protein